MRLIHTADWHLGRLFHNQHLTDDQAHVLDQLIDLARDVRPAAVIVAGDLYDRAVPPTEAVTLLDEVLTRLVDDLGIPVIAIAGNHDSAARVGFAGRLLRERGLHVVGELQQAASPIILRDEHGPVRVSALPFADPAVARDAYDDPGIHDQQGVIAAGVRAALAGAEPGERHVLVAHAFVAGGLESESERPLTVGGAQQVPVSVFDGFDYVALGHLHRPQSCSVPAVRYAGSLLKYSFAESAHAKSVSLVEIGPRGSAAGEAGHAGAAAVTVEEIALSPLRDVRRVEGTLAELLDRGPGDPHRDDYVLGVLLDDGALFDPIGRLRDAYPNVLAIERPAYVHAGAGGERPRPGSVGDVELFEAFFSYVTDGELGGVRRTALAGLLDELERRRRGGSGVRPLRVVIQAFGPYAGEQVLDFAELHGKSFFLITGPTGSGKTTVLDAMSFALYGVTSGGPESEGGRSGASMRSDHADPQLLTRVEFDFALGQRLYRVVREPEQERPKLKGEGTTTHGQTARVWRLRVAAHGLETDGAPIETGWTKVGAVSESLLGFRSEQFRQVVMLPQGRFQKLLEADSKEREQILKALFDTGHYAAVEAELKRAAKGLSDEARTLRDKRDEALRQAESESVDGLSERRARQSLEAEEAAGHAAEAEQARDAAQTRLQAGKDAVARLAELAAAEAAHVAVAERARHVAGARAELEAAEQASTVAAAHARVAAARAAAQTRRDAVEACDERRLAAAEAATAAQERLDKLEKAGAEREAAADEVRRLTALVGATGDLATARMAAERAEAAAVQARSTAAAAGSRWTTACDLATRADTRWLEAQAGRLAGDLQDGAPCPVCGSTEHPAPAELPPECPAQDDVEALRTAAETASDARDAATRKLLEAESVAAAAAALFEERRKAAPAEFDDPAALQAAIAVAQERSSALKLAHQAAVRAAHDAATAAATAAAAAATAADELISADDEVRVACEQLAGRLDEAGFGDEETWLRACRPPDEVDRLRVLVADHAERAARAAERLRLAHERADGVSAPDLEALESAARAAASTALAARTAAVELAQAAETAGRQLERLEELEREAAAVHERYEVVGRLADVANGDNPRHLSFQRYVLGAFLDDVLVAASQRLHLMTKGRYRLERTERRFGGKAAAGLNLEVYDAWTGVARPVATLSGGETFMAALSLALGLAEVVQAHAGGKFLETVFVDEGFGSLDDEALDLAVSALMDLGEDGRLVGIISHVSELRERIDARLEVTAGKSGSQAAFRVS